jgi:hypothetical protein
LYQQKIRYENHRNGFFREHQQPLIMGLVEKGHYSNRNQLPPFDYFDPALDIIAATRQQVGNYKKQLPPLIYR